MAENKTSAQNLIAEKRALPDSLPLPAEKLLELYYFLQFNRQLEARLETLFRQNKLFGGLYSSLGQEAISVGAAYALEPKDWLAPMIRNIGALLVKGFPPRDIFTQHMGRYTSPTRGKDGTSHFADLKVRHTVAPSSMLGDLIPVMTGVAMASRYLGHKSVALTFIGDGGSSTGAFHEGMNLAAAQRAPLVVILENNQWAYSTPVSKQVLLRDLAQRAAAYGIRSSIVDGNDVLALYRATRYALDECRAGRGPFLIEAKTMRMKGHAQHDAAEYVPPEMMAHWKSLDPIARYEKYLTENNLWDIEQKAAIDSRIEREMDAEQKIAEEAPMPQPESAAEGVYCEGCHTIAADWRRNKNEVTPPATITEAAWKIAHFGSLQKPAPQPLPSAPAKQPATAKVRPPAAQTEKKAPEPAVAATKPEGSDETPLRVPFGRGPKDRAFAAEQPQNPQHSRSRGSQRHQGSAPRKPQQNPQYTPKRNSPPRNDRKRKP